MLMEALFSRGGMPIHHRINGFDYTFRRNDDGDFVCPVLSGEHRHMMIQGGNFRMYVPKVKEPAEVSEEVTFAPEEGAAPTASKQLIVEDCFDAVSAEVAQAKEEFDRDIAAMNAPATDKPVKPRRGGRRNQK